MNTLRRQWRRLWKGWRASECKHLNGQKIRFLWAQKEEGEQYENTVRCSTISHYHNIPALFKWLRSKHCCHLWTVSTTLLKCIVPYNVCYYTLSLTPFISHIVPYYICYTLCLTQVMSREPYFILLYLAFSCLFHDILPLAFSFNLSNNPEWKHPMNTSPFLIRV